MSFIINLYGAPGAGKSTMRAGLFYNLKIKGYNVEEVTEYAKDLTWEGRTFALQCQPYVFAKQLRNVERVLSQVEAVITDSPLLLSSFYGQKYTDGKYPSSFYEYVKDQAKALPSVNFFIPRNKPYNPIGRNQTQEESDQIAIELQLMLKSSNIYYQKISSLEEILSMTIRLIDDQRNS